MYAKIAKELGIEGTDESDVIVEIRGLRNASKEVADGLANVPVSLTKAIEIAKQGGDYLSYLGVSSIDYENVDGITLLETQLSGLFTNEEGKFDREGYDEYIESLSDKEIEIRGALLKKELIISQQNEQTKLTLEAETRRVEAERELKGVIEATTEIRGFKLGPSHKRDFYKTITSGDIIQEMFYTDNKMDYNKVIKAYFDYKYGTKADTFLKQRITTAAKKTILKDLSNSNIENVAETLTDAKPEVKSGIDRYMEELGVVKAN